MIRNKKFGKPITVLLCLAIVAAALLAAIFIEKNNNTVKTEMTLESAQSFVNNELDALPAKQALSAVYLRENTVVTVEDIEYGTEKNIVLSCTYKTLNISKVIRENINSLLNIDMINEATGTVKNATKIQIEIRDKLQALLENADTVEGETQIEIYEMKDGALSLYLDSTVVNTLFGGIIDATNTVKETNEITVNGEKVDISNRTSLKNGLIQCFTLVNYDSSKPDTSGTLMRVFNSLKKDFVNNFIEDGRWKYLASGLGNTLRVTLLSLLLGLVIGFIVAVIRCTYAKTGKLKLLDSVCRLYLSIMRGTPVMIQLLIIYFVFLLPLGVAKLTSAVLCFGINSGAYVSEIVRGGIMSVDGGQMEAGRSLGFNYVSTMWYIVLPQAIKAVLPALANEFIALLKETSVAFYIGVADLTMGGLKIRSITYSNFMPLVAIGLIYLILVLGLSYLVSRLERRLNKGDRS